MQRDARLWVVLACVMVLIVVMVAVAVQNRDDGGQVASGSAGPFVAPEAPRAEAAGIGGMSVAVVSEAPTSVEAPAPTATEMPSRPISGPAAVVKACMDTLASGDRTSAKQYLSEDGLRYIRETIRGPMSIVDFLEGMPEALKGWNMYEGKFAYDETEISGRTARVPVTWYELEGSNRIGDNTMFRKYMRLDIILGQQGSGWLIDAISETEEIKSTPNNVGPEVSADGINVSDMAEGD